MLGDRLDEPFRILETDFNGRPSLTAFLDRDGNVIPGGGRTQLEGRVLMVSNLTKDFTVLSSDAR